MMTPEEIIAAFLQIWEDNPDKIFEKSGAVNGLEHLNKLLAQSLNDSNEDFANKLGEWCQEYPELTTVVVAAGERKVKLEHNISTQDNGNILHNEYPEISPTLRKRLPKIAEGKTRNE